MKHPQSSLRLPQQSRPPLTIWLKHSTLPWRLLPWLCLFIAGAGYQFWLGFDYNSNDTTNLYLRLARGAAYLLLVVLTVLWLPVMRHGISALRRSKLGEWLPLDQAKACHRWLGHLCMAAALLHGSHYLLYYNSLSIPFSAALIGEEADLLRSMRSTMYEFVSDDHSIEQLHAWIQAGRSEAQYDAEIRPILKEDCTKCHSRSSTMTYAIPSLPLTDYADVLALSDSGLASRQFRINASGLAMLLLLLPLWASALAWVRQHYHHRFQQLHRLGYLVALLALLHIPSLAWLVVPLLILASEVYYSSVQRRYRRCPAQGSALINEVVRLDIKRPATLSLRGGHYVQVRIPVLSRTEWHAFSLTGPRNDPQRLILKIRCRGDWTRLLLQHINDHPNETLYVDLRGPFASPTAHARATDDWLLIAGGMGITPFLSLLRELKHQPTRQGNLHLVWTLRESALLHWLLPLIERLSSNCAVRCRWHIYLTGNHPENKTDPVSEVLALHPRLADIPTLTIRQGRPDWQRLTQQIAASDNQPSCFICGPKSLSREAGRACRAYGWPVREEHF